MIVERLSSKTETLKHTCCFLPESRILDLEKKRNKSTPCALFAHLQVLCPVFAGCLWDHPARHAAAASAQFLGNVRVVVSSGMNHQRPAFEIG